jgi:glycosidase
MTPFIGSHDSSRFISLAEAHGASDLPHHKWPEQGLPQAPASDAAYQRAALAYVWLLSLPGAPLLYYGDEYGEYGGADPDNRHMWRPAGQRTAREQALHELVSRMGRARRDHVALRQGGYRTLVAEETFLCFARETQATYAIVAINRGAAPVTRQVAIPGNGSTLVDVLSPAGATVGVVGGMATVTVPAMSAVVLVPQ